MVRLTLAQMRRSLGRLTAAGLAIAIGTAFVAATLLAGDLMNRTGVDAVTARYGQADVVVTGTVTDADVAAVRALPGVAAAELMVPLGVELTTASEQRWQTVLPQVADERLTPLRVSSGVAPSAPGQIALPQRAADAFHVRLGDTLTAVWTQPAANGAEKRQTQTMTLVGIAADPHGAWTESGGAGIVTATDAEHWYGVTSLVDAGTAALVVAGASGDAPATLRADVAHAVPGATVQTRDEAAADELEQLGNGGGTALISVVLGFAAVALLVAALVIANTFQVLVAQRTRTLALLRAVGARRRQIRGSVLLEASVLGLASSLVGLVAGTALAQATLLVLRRTSVDVPLPSTVHVTWQVVVLPLVVGPAVTLLASLVPARAATHVTAIEALRPIDAPTARAGAGRARLAVSVLLVVGGAVLLGGATLLGLHADDRTLSNGLPLAAGVLGGALSFVGVLLSAVFWVPPLVRLAQGALGRLGPVARLAGANTTRNPRRTAATSTALLIGVTLVVMMSTGAASARASLGGALDEHFPVDISVTPAGSSDQALPDGLAAKVAAIQGVGHVVTLRSAQVSVTGADGQQTEVTARALTPAEAATVFRDRGAAGKLADGAVLLPASLSGAPATVELRAVGADGSPAGTAVRLRHETVPGLAEALVTPATLDQLAPHAVADTLYVSLDGTVDPADALRSVQDSLGSGQLHVTGAGAQRAQFDRVINNLLAVVVGLLGVAVLIALLGVTNTLSLSVLERRRESATLRAIGLTRGGLRGALAVEGVLIAGVGAVLGILFGLVYGWAGAATVLGQTGRFTLAVSWRDLVLVVVIALGAGLLASVLPARSAVRTPPVAALAEE